MSVFAADELEQEYGLWRADADDVEDISTPAGRLIYRRLPDEAKESDTIDLVNLGFALLGYVGKNFAKKLAIKQLRAQQGGQAPADTAAAAATP